MSIEIIIGFAGVVAGSIIGFLIKKIFDGKETERSKNKANEIIEKAKNQGKELLVSAKDESLKIKETAKREESEKQRYLVELEKNIRKREDSLSRRFDDLDKNQKSTEDQRKKIEEIKENLRTIRKKQEESLERISKMKKDDAKKVLLDLVEKESKEELAEKIKIQNQYIKEEATAHASKIIATAMMRLAPDFTVENTVSSVAIPSDEMKGRIIGREGRNIQAFEKETGVDVIIDDTPDVIVLSSFDPVRRQIARVAMEKLVADGRIHPTRIEEVVAKAKEEVALDVKKAGEQAAFEVGIAGLPPEILRVLGRLKYRTSYGQNQLQHSIEASFIAGMLAEELHADINLAKKAGLLHDLGKAIDQEVSGSHAIISGDIARKYGLPANLVHAIEAHHEDVEIKTTEAAIVQTADAISGARPGARRETMESYVKRLKDLEQIASSFEGVEKTYAIQAGREIRIIVKPEEIDDLTSEKISKEIAKRIEEEMQYPGQIKVNVIRETRAIEYAK
jgi:ribonuclease Y